MALTTNNIVTGTQWYNGGAAIAYTPAPVADAVVLIAVTGYDGLANTQLTAVEVDGVTVTLDAASASPSANIGCAGIVVVPSTGADMAIRPVSNGDSNLPFYVSIMTLGGANVGDPVAGSTSAGPVTPATTTLSATAGNYVFSAMCAATNAASLGSGGAQTVITSPSPYGHAYGLGESFAAADGDISHVWNGRNGRSALAMIEVNETSNGDQASALDPPTLGTPVNITDTSADLPFTLTGDADQIEVTVGGNTVLYDQASPFSAMGLAADTTYGWSARAYDVETDSYSASVAGANFTTAAAPPGISVSYSSEYFPFVRLAYGSTAALSVTATVEGVSGDLEIRLYDIDAEAAVIDWQAFGTVSGGGVTANLSGIPAGGGRDPAGTFRIEVRSVADNAIVGAGPLFGVGHTFIPVGQSNIERWDENYSGLSLNVMARRSNFGDTHVSLIGDGFVTFANVFTELTGVPLLLIPGYSGGKPISYWDKAGGGAGYGPVVTYANRKAGNSPMMILFNQGEGGAEAGYLTELTELADNFRSDIRADLDFVAIPGLYNSMALSVRQAHYDFADASAHNHTAAHHPDLIRDYTVDTTHLSGAGYQIMATRAAQFAAHLFFGVDVAHVGPSIAAAEGISDTVTDVTLAHSDGADITPASGITGFAVSDAEAGTYTPATGVRIAANKVRLTHAAIAGTRYVKYMAVAPNVSGALFDDAGYALEPQFAAVEAEGAAVPVANIVPEATQMIWDSGTPAVDFTAGASVLVPETRAVAMRSTGAAVWPGGTGLSRVRRGRTLMPRRDLRTRRIPAG